MLRDAELPLRFSEHQVFLDFLGPHDQPWLRVLLAEMVRFEGRRARELGERLAEPLPCEAPYVKRRAATRALWRLWRRERKAAVRPVSARSELFGAAAAAAAPSLEHQRLFEEVAARLEISVPALRESLFADLPGERVVRAPEPVPTAIEAALHTNLAIAQSVLMRAASIELQVEGAVRPIVRLAKLRGLLCSVVVDKPGDVLTGSTLAIAPSTPVLHISGPFALFRHTLVYGRALAELLSHLAWCARFQLRAACALRGRIVDVTIASGDPVFPAAAPPAFDSRLEERFARDFGRLAPDWDLVREPEAVSAGQTLIFPDFLLRHRRATDRPVLLEIAGFWTPDYLVAKLARLRDAQLTRFILCIDEERSCSQDDLPAGVTVLRFRRRIDAAAVLREAERLATKGAIPS